MRERTVSNELVQGPQGESVYAPVPAVPSQHHQVTYVQVSAPPKGASVTSMVLGLVSIVMGFTFFLPLIGLICAFVGLAREPAGRAYAVVGLLLNGFFILLWLLFLGFLLASGTLGSIFGWYR